MDIDGDGTPDLLSGSNCCDSWGFHVFRSKGNNSWEPLQTYHVNEKSKFGGDFRFMHRSIVSAADWDGDGIPDLLWDAGRGIGVARGPVRAGGPLDVTDEIDFTPRPVKESEYVLGFALADWDRDGEPDLLVELKLDGDRSGIYWYRNLGDRGLKRLAPGELVLSHRRLGDDVPSNRWHLYGFCVGDWDGDGWPDLIVTRQDGEGTKWRNSVWLYRLE